MTLFSYGHEQVHSSLSFKLSKFKLFTRSKANQETEHKSTKKKKIYEKAIKSLNSVIVFELYFLRENFKNEFRVVLQKAAC